ncbi:hypothetical protein PtA15_3A401 [Puccinia triticina]|uniref:Elongation of fatty acids protein n=1 Tax=Puccinia triticina TaxID=208348 RepID=A0ABY7CD45_9BASI|nr:uncharacterized protein PtA15_3A401 [Puccinia triticina]WAQ83035.1 hypothetical protein PtA15_3A401 [Puccinia triticina]WAR53869.1 hypothetical protein PtB15_3B378 [Puccinia triticina]
MPILWELSTKLFAQLPPVPSHFTQWEPPQSPLSTYSGVFAAIVTYLSIIFGGQRLMADRKPMQFKPLFMLHNILLSLGGRTSVSWVPISANLTVHVIMYYYYFTTSAFPGYKPWYKKALTTLQISQFVIDLFIVYFASYSYFAAEYLGWPTMGNCTGTEGAALFGCAILTSYLFLFISFYRKTYKQKSAKGRAPVSSSQAETDSSTVTKKK